MDWKRFAQGQRLDPTAGGEPEAVVVLLPDIGQSVAPLLAIAARWAATVPTTAFVAFDGIDRLDPQACRREWRSMLSWRFDAGRLVLVGYRHGATVALHLALRRGWRCAGVLAFSPRLIQPLPRVISIDAKIRLIESEQGQVGHADLRDAVLSLVARGVDARGILLPAPPLSDEAVRHGGAYLMELIATAQRGERIHVLERALGLAE
jgi:hypothetical protein